MVITFANIAITVDQIEFQTIITMQKTTIITIFTKKNTQQELEILCIMKKE